MKIVKYKDASSIWLTYKEDLHRYLLRKVKDKEVANELSSVILMKIYKSCCSDIEVRNIKSWLYRIARNALVDYYKKANSTSPKIPEIVSETDESSAYREAAQFVESLIQLLPSKYSTVLRMSDILDIKQADIARELNLSLTATKSRVQRGRKLLKKKIVECCDIETAENGTLVSLAIKSHCTPLAACNRKKTS